VPGYRIEIREPGKPPAVELIADAPLEVGRECDGLVIDDPRASRRHLRLTPGVGGLAAVDLGSTNGTTLNGAALPPGATLAPGDILQLGDTTLTLLAPATDVFSAVAPESPPPAPATSEPEPSPPTLVEPPPVRPVLDELASRETDAAVIRYRPGSSGERAAAGMATAIRRARRRLSGLGSEPWGTKPQVCLVDPFPDPDQPAQIMTSGTVVDAERAEVWMVVTAESPPEPPERPLALLFGASLPAARDLGFLLEGYGLHVAEAPDPDPGLRDVALPPLEGGDEVDDDLIAAARLSFVRHLVARGGDDGVRRLLAEARPRRLDAAAEEVFGSTMGALEDGWRQKLAAGPPKVRTRQFLKLSARYLRPHVRREAEMAVYMVGSLVFTTVYPFAFRRLLDTAIPSGEFSQVLGVLIALGIAFVVSLLAGLRRAYLSAYVSGAVVREIRAQMFGKLQALSVGWFGRQQQGDVVSRLFSDVAILEGGLSQTLREGAFQFVSLVVSSVVLFMLNPLLAVIVLLGAPLVGLVYRGMATGAEARSQAVQERTGALYSLATENFGAQGVVKAFALEGREKARFGRGADRLFKSQVRLQLFGGLFGLSVNMIVTILRLVVLGLGAWLILEGRFTIGGLVAFVSLMGEVLAPVTVLTTIGQQVQASTGALTRINEVLESAPDIADEPDAISLPPVSREIRLSNVSFSYTPERRTLEGIDGVISAGSRVAFVGPTGAGKSSVLSLLMRFVEPEEGAVLFDGTDIRKGTLTSLRGQLGVVFQETFLFDTTIRENIALGKPGATDAEIEEAARSAELHDFVVTLPRGYDSPTGERGSRLSGGQRQRLAIARALIRNPAVLVLDEATSALDPRTERMIATTLTRVGEGRTTVSVTHRLASITDYDRIFVLDAGKLVEQGTHDELLRLEGVYATLWAEQTGGVVGAEAPFDALGALRRVPVFSTLSDEELAAAVERLRAADLAPGQSVAEGGGQLVLVRRGRPRVVVGSDGVDVPVAELQPGDAFGVSALLGHDSGAKLSAVDPVALLVLDGDSIAALAAKVPAFASALEGRRPAAAQPAGGRRLSRLTAGPGMTGQLAVLPTRPSIAPQIAEDVRRATGSFGGVPR
jgi:ABC-type multidrug transport system fused ATPase/permease subunit